MRALVIGEEQKLAIGQVIDYATKENHWFTPGVDRKIPGSIPQHVVYLPVEYKCVFTITRHHGQFWRHLSVSVPGDKYPSPESCVMVAKEFGFTSCNDDLQLERRYMDGWIVRVDEYDHCVQLLQPLEPQPKPAGA